MSDQPSETPRTDACRQCNGQGWYMDGPTDDPQQRQCLGCYGTGKGDECRNDPQTVDRLRSQLDVATEALRHIQIIREGVAITSIFAREALDKMKAMERKME